MEQVVEASAAGRKRQHHPGHGHRGRLGTHRHQFIQFALQTSQKQQGIETQGGQLLEAAKGAHIDLAHPLRGD